MNNLTQWHLRAPRSVAIAALALASAVPVTQAAEAESPWLVRATAIVITPDVESGALDLDVEDMVDLAADVTYFFAPNVAVNVLATILGPEVESGGASLGSVTLVPPIVTLQYHFVPGPTSFYVGGGFNYNLFYGESGTLAAIDAEVDDTIGYVLQVGVDHELSSSTVLNLDLKFLTLEADVDVGGDTADELELDAFIFGVGLGWRM